MLYNGRLFPPKLHHFPPPQKYPFIRDLAPRLIHGSLGPAESTTQMASQFLHSSRHSVPILHNGSTLLPPNCPFTCGCRSPFTTWFIGPTRLHNPNSISISSQPFLQMVTDRLIDRQTTTLSITIGCIYIHSTAMRPSNNDNKRCSLVTVKCSNHEQHTHKPTTQYASCRNQTIYSLSRRSAATHKQ